MSDGPINPCWLDKRYLFGLSFCLFNLTFRFSLPKSRSISALSLWHIGFGFVVPHSGQNFPVAETGSSLGTMGSPEPSLFLRGGGWLLASSLDSELPVGQRLHVPDVVVPLFGSQEGVRKCWLSEEKKGWWIRSSSSKALQMTSLPSVAGNGKGPLKRESTWQSS